MCLAMVHVASSHQTQGKLTICRESLNEKLCSVSSNKVCIFKIWIYIEQNLSDLDGFNVKEWKFSYLFSEKFYFQGCEFSENLLISEFFSSKYYSWYSYLVLVFPALSEFFYVDSSHPCTYYWIVSYRFSSCQAFFSNYGKIQLFLQLGIFLQII